MTAIADLSSPVVHAWAGRLTQIARILAEQVVAAAAAGFGCIPTTAPSCVPAEQRQLADANAQLAIGQTKLAGGDLPGAATAFDAATLAVTRSGSPPGRGPR